MQVLPGIICVLAWMEITPFLSLKVFQQSIGMIFGMGNLPTSMANQHGTELVLSGSAGAVSLQQFFFAMRPWIQKQAHGVQELQHARTLLNLYSQNPLLLSGTGR